ncbi:MAG: ATP-binding protein, partial [Candidatus Poribacteria bacterium]
MKAKNLDDIYTIFDPSQPLPGVSEYYVKRKYNPLEEIKRNLLLNNIHPPKYLFAGHRGSGKSTELNRLMAYPEIQEKYFTVNYS